MTSRRLLEICCADSDSVIAAVNGGADRIELCMALDCGGLTPSSALIKYATSISPILVNVLIRPREGDFIYTDTEARIMEQDITFAAKAGAAGVVVGALTTEGEIDIPLCQRLIETAHDNGLNVTFHRAFDLCREPMEAFRQIMSLGCDRLLTSGQAPSAIAGARLIAQLKQMSQGKTIILAGAGVHPDNAAEIIRLTGVSELHASAKTTIQSRSGFRIGGVNMGAPETDEYSRTTTSENIVRQLAKIIHRQ